MRRLEIALVICLVLQVIDVLSPWRRGWSWLLALAGILLVLGQVFFEGQRWQTAPAYLLASLIALFHFLPLLTVSGLPYGIFDRSYLFGLGGLLCIGLTVVLSTLAPVFRLPAPTGPYEIGTQIRHLVDAGRIDSRADRPGSSRELMIQLWYPAEAATRGRYAPYREQRLTTIRNRRLSMVETRSLSNAPVLNSGRPHPVLIYSPSWRGQRSENTFLSEELASHGYVVVAMDHTYSTSATAFPDGRIARTKLLIEEDYSSDKAFESFISATEEEVKTRSDDALFVLDTLERLNTGDPERLLDGRLDIGHVGIFGFSFGGSVAAEACWRDNRFRAGVDLDGMIAGQSARYGTAAPFLFVMTNDPPAPDHLSGNIDFAMRREAEFNWSQFRLMQASISKYGGYWMTIQGTTHPNFSDVPFYSPLRGKTGAGPVDPEAAARVISRYIRAFFDSELRNIDEPLLKGAPLSDPQVQYRIRESQR